MYNLNGFIIALSLCLLAFPSFYASNGEKGNSDGWKAGVARVKITPKESTWIAGYAARDHSSEGKLNDLWAKALALEDINGKRAVLITTDLVGIQKSMSDTIRNRLQKEYNLSRSQIILNSSHTHSGPVVSQRHIKAYGLPSDEADKIDRYSRTLETLIVKMVGRAINSMKPVSIFTGNGITRFQVNRRNNNEKTLTSQTELKGPNDHAVPVLKVTDYKGKLLAIAFGYACHATVLNGYDWSGDYPGYAQEYLEDQYPGATALFFQGAGGNQNPLPRRSIPLTQQYGGELACAVKRVLNEDMEPLSPTLSTAYDEVELQFEKLPSQQELMQMSTNSLGYEQFWAKLMLDIIKYKSLPCSYPYPIQVWKIGDQLLLTMGGEAVIEYAIKLKQMFGPDIFILGYSNDVMAYIPTTEILKEGGYEGAISQMYYGLPGKWKPTIEKTILQGMAKLADQVKFPLTKEQKEKIEKITNGNTPVPSVQEKPNQ